MTNKVIMFDSPEAARFVTGISGWVDSKGLFWGNDESQARYSGCTHRPCRQCGQPTLRAYLFCEECRQQRDVENWNAAEKMMWDRDTPIYSAAFDHYFYCEEELYDFILENQCDIEDLRLLLCQANYLRCVDESYFSDVLCEDSELPVDVLEAIEVFNTVLRKQGPISWSPSKQAVILDEG